MTHQTDTARTLLHRHGVPEDIVDGALGLHAQELAALQRLRMDELDLTGQKARIVGRIVDLIDPVKTPASVSSAGQAPATDRDAEELTAEEARALADDLGLQLYRAQDALSFVGECCDIADREGRPVTTAVVREWLKGARCGRQLAADAADQAADDVRGQLLHALDFSACQTLGYGTPEELVAAYDAARTAPADRAAARCPSCDHEAGFHDVDGRCWFSVEQGAPGHNVACACLLRRMADEAQPTQTETDDAQPLCGKTQGTSGLYYRPCARTAGHKEAYCRSADGGHLFLAASPSAGPGVAARGDEEA